MLHKAVASIRYGGNSPAPNSSAAPPDGFCHNHGRKPALTMKQLPHNIFEKSNESLSLKNLLKFSKNFLCFSKVFKILNQFF